MKNYSLQTALLCLLVFSCIEICNGQDANLLTVNNPFDSLVISNVKAIGNKTTGALKITMDFMNISQKHQTAHLSLGGFEDFGITSNQGKRYKVFSAQNVIGNSQPNSGFQKIAAVQFGSKTLDWVTSLIQELNPGDKRTLSVSIGKFDKVDRQIKNLHIRCILFIGYKHSGDKNYIVENIPIEWTETTSKVK